MIILSSLGPVAFLKCEVLYGLAWNYLLTCLFYLQLILTDQTMCNYLISFPNVLLFLRCYFLCFSVVQLLHFVMKLGPKQQLLLVKMNLNSMDGSVAIVFPYISFVYFFFISYLCIKLLCTIIIRPLLFHNGHLLGQWMKF